MTSLSSLQNVTRPAKRRKLLGRGIGSNSGKTCGRGHKGHGSRSGWTARHGKEGGQVPLYLRLPTRGFSRAAFRKEVATINLGLIEELFENNEVVNIKSLRAKGFLGNHKGALKILGDGELTKQVTIEAHQFSASALEKLKQAGIKFNVVELKSATNTL